MTSAAFANDTNGTRDGLLAQWRGDWATNRGAFCLELVGTVSSNLASFLISLLASDPPMLPIFVLWLTGASTILASSDIRQNAFMMLLKGLKDALNAPGLVNAPTA
ncbi:hypothetical protein [Arenibaculum pallidiluteum]|uniref:hypothetical protein n=1 Tax=Arenibaculum pallidiluteum TaxID=2812559 RepID=UPI001A97572D|nr:hypothetical protein [Arenibaculum pallidiluteum]